MKTLRWFIPFAMMSALLVVGCGSDSTDDGAAQALPPGSTTADAERPVTSTNAGTEAPAIPQ